MGQRLARLPPGRSRARRRSRPGVAWAATGPAWSRIAKTSAAPVDSARYRSATDPRQTGFIVVAQLLKESPASTQLFKAAYRQISADLEEAARLSGATWPIVYARVLLPLLAPTAATIWLLAFASSIRDIGTSVLLYSQSRPLSILMWAS